MMHAAEANIGRGFREPWKLWGSKDAIWQSAIMFTGRCTASIICVFQIQTSFALGIIGGGVTCGILVTFWTLLP